MTDPTHFPGDSSISIRVAQHSDIPKEASLEDVSVLPKVDELSKPLPPGKLYHVFLSYRAGGPTTSLDRTWVRNVREKLENEYGYVCCDHERDFIPGWKIVDNITHCIMSSVKTVIVLSEQAVKSPWCSLEAELSLTMNLDMRKRTLIPVIIEQCEIPPHLSSLAYIDGRENPDVWWPALIRAINSAGCPSFEEAGFTRPLNSQPFMFNPFYTNLDKIHEIRSSCTCFCVCPAAIQILYLPDGLSNRGIKIPPSVFSQLMNELKQNQRFRRHGCCFEWIGWLILFCCMAIAIFITCILLMGGYDAYYTRNILGSSIIGSIILPTLIGLLVRCLIWKRTRTSLRRQLAILNRGLLPYHLMATVQNVRCGEWLNITFVYYNYQPCLDFVMERLSSNRQKDETSSSSPSPRDATSYDDDISATVPLTETRAQIDPDDDVNDDDEGEKEAMVTLLEDSGRYLSLYLQEELPLPDDQRHTRQAMCLCQYWEMKSIKKT